jgi:protein SCO1/2
LSSLPRRTRAALLAAAGIGLAVACPLAAPPLAAQGRRPTADAAAAQLPAALQEVGIEQRVGEALPLDARFRDETGKAVRLGDYFDDRPVILVPVYYRCPMLCTLMVEGVARALKALSFGSGADYRLVVFSFDPTETPADAAEDKAHAVDLYDRPGSEAWHFLTGDAEAVGALTRAIGFRYDYDAGRGEFVHASTLVLATPEGRIARYLYTTEPAPKDLRLALVEASAGTIGTVADHVLLYCFRYDATTGKYTLLTMRLVRIGAAVTIFGLALFIGYMVRQEKRGAAARAAVPVIERTR